MKRWSLDSRNSGVTVHSTQHGERPSDLLESNGLCILCGKLRSRDYFLLGFFAERSNGCGDCDYNDEYGNGPLVGAWYGGRAFPQMYDESAGRDELHRNSCHHHQ
jgi:hypothetical protein